MYSFLRLLFLVGTLLVNTPVTTAETTNWGPVDAIISLTFNTRIVNGATQDVNFYDVSADLKSALGLYLQDVLGALATQYQVDDALWNVKVVGLRNDGVVYCPDSVDRDDDECQEVYVAVGLYVPDELDVLEAQASFEIVFYEGLNDGQLQTWMEVQAPDSLLQVLPLESDSASTNGPSPTAAPTTSPTQEDNDGNPQATEVPKQGTVAPTTTLAPTQPRGGMDALEDDDSRTVVVLIGVAIGLLVVLLIIGLVYIIVPLVRSRRSLLPNGQKLSGDQLQVNPTFETDSSGGPTPPTSPLRVGFPSSATPVAAYGLPINYSVASSLTHSNKYEQTTNSEYSVLGSHGWQSALGGDDNYTMSSLGSFLPRNSERSSIEGAELRVRSESDVSSFVAETVDNASVYAESEIFQDDNHYDTDESQSQTGGELSLSDGLAVPSTGPVLVRKGSVRSNGRGTVDSSPLGTPSSSEHSQGAQALERMIATGDWSGIIDVTSSYERAASNRPNPIANMVVTPRSDDSDDGTHDFV
eukprot:Nitzschia sp. Nitz4//scaffold109_size72162//17933//19513//NITZ4_005838-RA/size72162-processed-gene-0.7-mRNA-1//1//CDS//3329532739//6476//frame0